jgi:16S rRNA (adenine1518-N6/adenine1519-N6)-dimethyltransferase
MPFVPSAFPDMGQDSSERRQGPRPPGRAELLETMEQAGLRPSRALGQNFLVDPNTAERIVRLSGVTAGEKVLEVGAGLGSLTIALAAAGAEVLAVEIDRHLTPVLRRMVEPLGVSVLEEDALFADWGAVLKGGPWRLVANLPYNIATPLLLNLLEHVPAIEEMFVMVQREVAERLAGLPGTKAYGAVTVRAAYFATTRIAGYVPPNVFVPRPNVESALLQLSRRHSPAVPESLASFEEIDRLVRAGFSERRKMLRRSLGSLVSEEAFKAAGIESTRRPEELVIEEWGALAAAVAGGG